MINNFSKIYEGNDANSATEIIVKINSTTELLMLRDVYYNVFNTRLSFNQYLDDDEFEKFPYFLFIDINKEREIYYEGKKFDISVLDKHNETKDTYNIIFDYYNPLDRKKVFEILTHHKILIKPDYSSKELVYERKTDNVINVIYKPKDIKENYKIQEFAFINGYGWNENSSKEIRTSFQSTGKIYLIFSNTTEYPKRLYYNNYVNEDVEYIENDINNALEGGLGNTMLLTDINQLMTFLKIGKVIILPDYNKPKELVYEGLEHYYNPILKHSTQYKYRFKTEDEFIKEKGKDWVRYIKYGWVFPHMSYLFGIDLKINDVDINSEFIACDYDEKWIISSNMIKENDINKPNYNTSKKLVYEMFNNEEDSQFLCIKVEDWEELDKLKKLYKYYYGNELDIHPSVFPCYVFPDYEKVGESGWELLSFLNGETIENSNMGNYVYNKIFDFSLQKDLNQLKNIFKNKKIINNIPDYSSKELIYERKGIYYNKITKENTTQPYRFKTRDEFINEFGLKWEEYLSVGWGYSMNYLMGTDYKYEINLEFDINIKNITITNYYDSRWVISSDMITKNDNEKPDYSAKELVYEGKNNFCNIIKNESTIYPYRFKTEDEFMKEFGYNWENNILNGWNDDMNYLLGSDYKFSIDLKFDENKKKAITIHRLYDDKWYISTHMLTKNEQNKPNYSSKKLIYERKLLKFNKFKN